MVTLLGHISSDVIPAAHTKRIQAEQYAASEAAKRQQVEAQLAVARLENTERVFEKEKISIGNG